MNNCFKNIIPHSYEKLTNWQKAAEKQAEFGFIKKLTKQFPKSEVYLVGGAVRDILINRNTKDF